jgi:hypothetical protein
MDGWIDVDGIKMDGSCTILAHLEWIQDWVDGCMDVWTGWMDGWEDGCMYVCLSLCAHESWGVVFNTFSSIFFFFLFFST